MRRALPLAAALAALALAPGADARPGTTERFAGPSAFEAAGTFISQLISYPADYSPGLLAVRYVPVFDRAFATIVRFSQVHGHQVVMGKLENRPDLEAGGSCAAFRVVVEHFTDETREGLAIARGDLRLAIEREDVVEAEICVSPENAVRVAVAHVAVATPARGRAAFGIPFAGDASGGL